jgi:hypothetical protein
MAAGIRRAAGAGPQPNAAIFAIVRFAQQAAQLNV